MFISIILPVRNRPESLPLAVQSVIGQTYHNWQLIIVDDGSKDSTRQIGQSYANQYPNKIYFIQNDRHLGVSATRNRGIEWARGDWLAFLDSDDYWLPDKLAQQEKFHQQNQHYRISQTQEQWIRKGRRVNPGKIHAKQAGDIFEKCLQLCCITPSSVLLERNLLEQVGRFDEDLPACEDYELWLRIASREKIGLLDQELLIRTGGHADQLSVRYPAMDRFRIYALYKWLVYQKSSTATELVRQQLQKKWQVLRTGMQKRGKNTMELATILAKERYNLEDLKIVKRHFLTEKEWA